MSSALLGVGFALRLLFLHLRVATDPEEQIRTRLVLAAWGLGALLALSELVADLGVPVPRGGALGALASAAVLSVVVFRFRLLESELSSRAGIYALSIGALSVVAYLAVVYLFAAHTAMLALGTITITLALLAFVRQLTRRRRATKATDGGSGDPRSILGADGSRHEKSAGGAEGRRPVPA